jgi:thiamine biosynthesis lipoprotein
LEEQGITGYILNVGGNVRAVGEKPDGTGWTVGVENPEEGGDYTAYLSLTKESLVTSGSYQRYYLVDGKRYHHIIDPETLMPAEGFLSVSVLTSHSGQADALSTALFCMTREEGLSLVSSLPDTEAQWILSDGTVYTTKGWETRKIQP